MRELADGGLASGHRQPDQGEYYLSHWDATGRQRKWQLPSGGGPVTVGRSSSTEVCIDWDPQVSRVHAVLEHIGRRWTLSDDGFSRNGTFLNGVRISSRTRLRDRDKIRMGATVLTFCAPSPTTSQVTIIRDAPKGGVRLTDPQRAVLLALCRPYRDGKPYPTPATNQQIAQELSLSVDGVKTHLRALFQKFGIADLPQNQKRARLAEIARELGLA